MSNTEIADALQPNWGPEFVVDEDYPEVYLGASMTRSLPDEFLKERVAGLNEIAQAAYFKNEEWIENQGTYPDTQADFGSTYKLPGEDPLLLRIRVAGEHLQIYIHRYTTFQGKDMSSIAAFLLPFSADSQTARNHFQYTPDQIGLLSGLITSSEELPHREYLGLLSNFMREEARLID